MPRFLSLDYLSEVQNLKHSVLSRCLMTFQTRLGCNDAYSHDGTLDDYAYRTPWRKATLLDNDGTELAKQIKSLDKKNTATLETITLRECDDIDDPNPEIVPSSNPDSPPISNDDVLHIKERIKEGTEKHQKIKTNIDQQLSLETPVVLLLKKSLPKTEHLLRHLTSTIVQDPFTQEDGKAITEQSILRNDRLYSQKNTEIIQPSNLYYEQFELKELEKQDQCLEEVEVSSVVDTNMLYNVNDNLSTENVLGSINDDIEKLGGLKLAQNEPYDSNQPITVKKSPEEAFIEINKSANEICQHQDDGILESPSKTDISLLPIFLQNLMESLSKELIPTFEFPVLISAEEKEKLMQALITNERFFKDISTLILKVPVSPTKVLLDNLIQEAQMLLNAKPEHCSGELELNLTWDPVAASKPDVYRATEPLDMVASTEAKVVPTAVEEFFPLEYNEALTMAEDRMDLTLSEFSCVPSVVVDLTLSEVNLGVPSESEEKTADQLEGTVNGQSSIQTKTMDQNKQENQQHHMNNEQCEEISVEKDCMEIEENILKSQTQEKKSSYAEKDKGNDNRIDIGIQQHKSQIDISDKKKQKDLKKATSDKAEKYGGIFKVKKNMNQTQDGIKRRKLKHDESSRISLPLTGNPVDDFFMLRISSCKRNTKMGEDTTKMTGSVENAQTFVKRNQKMGEDTTKMTGSVENAQTFGKRNQKMGEDTTKMTGSVENAEKFGKRSIKMVENVAEIKTAMVENTSDDMKTRNTNTIGQKLTETLTVNEKSRAYNKNMEEEIRPTKEKQRKRTKSKIIEINLSESYQKILNILEDCAKPALRFLLSVGRLQQTATFYSLKPCATRFMMKQQHLQQMNNNNEYKFTIILHAMVSSADLLCRCDLTTVYIRIRAFQQKYRNILNDELQNVIDKMFDKLQILDKEQVQSPKIIELIEQLQSWYTRKITKEGSDHQPKILIIVSFDVPSLVNSICKSIGQLPYFICKDFAGSGYRDISSQLDHCNCLVLKESQIGEDFPWAHFSLVVGYAHRIESPWEEMCNRQNIRYFALKTVWPPHNDKNHLETSKAGETEPIVNAVIGSSAVTSNHHLLQLLEARFNFQVLERDYLTDQSPSTCQSFPDIVIDERTCIILLPSKQLTEENTVDFVINRIVGLSLQCCYCAVFICNDDASASYTYSGQMINNLARLHAVAAQYSPSTNDFEIKILYCYSQEQTAQLVRSVADASLERNPECKTRYKLSETISKQEKFLLSLPCFNSISAQQVLSTHGLRSIFQMSLPKMMETFAWLPNKVLEGLYSIMHRNEDIKPKLDLPFTENIPLDCREEGKAKSMASYHLHPKPSEIKVEPFEFPSLDFKKNEFHDFGTKDSIEHSVSRNLFPDKYKEIDQQYEHAMKGCPKFQDSNRFCSDNRIMNQPATFEHLPWDSHGIQSNMSGVSNSMSHHEHLAGDIFGNAVPNAFQSQQMNHCHTSPMQQFSTDLWNNTRMKIPGNLETQNKYSTSDDYKSSNTFGNRLSEQSIMSGDYKPRNTFDNSQSEPSVKSGAYKTNNTLNNHLLEESIMSVAYKPRNTFDNSQSEPSVKSGAYKTNNTLNNHLLEESIMSVAYKPRNTFDNSQSEPSVKSGAYKTNNTLNNHLLEESIMSGAYKPRNTFGNSQSEPSVKSGAYKTNNTFGNHLLEESIMSGAYKPRNIFNNPQSEQRAFRRDGFGYVGINEMPFDRVTANTQQEQKDCRFPNRFISSVQEDDLFNCAMSRRAENTTVPPNRKAYPLPWETLDAWKDP